MHRAVLVAGALAMATATHGAEGDQVTIVLTGDTGFNRSGQPVEADGVRRGGFQTWADTTSLIADDINGDLNFTNIETVVTDRNDLTPDTKGQGGPFNFRTPPTGCATSPCAASMCSRSPTTTRWTTGSRASRRR